MLSLISPLRVISLVAISYAFIVALTLFLAFTFFSPIKLQTAVRVALGGATFLDILLLLSVHFWWRRLWARFPALNTLLFPDLNGRWKMRIHWIGVDESGSVDAVAVIKQNLLHLSMEVLSEKSDSETLMARPKKDAESGRPLLYYVYRVIPKQNSTNAGASYEGAAILRFEEAESVPLSGNYFTSKKTRGYFELSRE